MSPAVTTPARARPGLPGVGRTIGAGEMAMSDVVERSRATGSDKTAPSGMSQAANRQAISAVLAQRGKRGVEQGMFVSKFINV